MLKNSEISIDYIVGRYATTPDQRVKLAEATKWWIKSVHEERQALQAELPTFEVEERLTTLSKLLAKAKTDLGNKRIAGTLIAEKHRAFYCGSIGEDYADRGREIQRSVRDDIDAISRLRDLASSALKRHKLQRPSARKAASQNSQPWLVTITTAALTIWKGVLNHKRRGRRFLEFYNDLCMLADIATVEVDGLKRRVKACRQIGVF